MAPDGTAPAPAAAIRTPLVFFGTPPAAVPSLIALAERFDVVLAVTQPERGQGGPIRVRARSAALTAGGPDGPDRWQRRHPSAASR
jgi:hypothetical protein